jgi:secreted Zn-dependent insulinase-like peptidase
MARTIRVSEKKYEALKKAVLDSYLSTDNRLEEANNEVFLKASGLVKFNKSEKKTIKAANKLYLGS